MAEHVEDPGFGEPQPAKSPPPSIAEAAASQGSATPSRSAAPNAAEIEKRFPPLKDRPGAVNTQPEVRWREVFSLLILVLLADITLFRSTGFAGPAAFLVMAPCLLALASPLARLSVPMIGVAVMIWLTAARLLWQGSPLVGAMGIILLVAFSMTLSQRPPYVLDVIGNTLKAWLDTTDSFVPYRKWLVSQGRRWPWLFSLHWILPSLAVGIFGTIFVAANPNLVEQVSQLWSTISAWIDNWIRVFSITQVEVFFCFAVAWYAVGLLRPADWSRAIADIFDNSWAEVEVTSKEKVNLLGEPKLVPEMVTFGPYRNTLIAVSVLFAVYLVFEFSTLWFKTFPKGFHYSGYAHEGAAWLTVALALATVMLSVTFRGPILQDSRLPKLKLWAWIWSAENFLLALAVYNRLWIYVGFNGMTRMRVIGVLGMTSVVVGFLLVLWKIARERNFVWLLRWQMLTVVFAGYLYLVLPVDWLIHSYNVRRIMAGDPAPVVQITEHPISPEGILVLPPLMQSSNAVIRDGIRSLLEDRAGLEASFNPNLLPGWTSRQLVHDRLASELAKLPPIDNSLEGQLKHTADWAALKTYAFQWY